MHAPLSTLLVPLLLTLLTTLLLTLSPSSPPLQVMFDFVGKVLVLQPEEGASFVARGERPHPMLPPQPGLFVLREPTPMSTVAGEGRCWGLEVRT